MISLHLKAHSRDVHLTFIPAIIFTLSSSSLSFVLLIRFGILVQEECANFTEEAFNLLE